MGDHRVTIRGVTGRSLTHVGVIGAKRETRPALAPTDANRRVGQSPPKIAERGGGMKSVEVVRSPYGVSVFYQPLQEPAGGSGVYSEPIGEHRGADRAFDEGLERLDDARDRVAAMGGGGPARLASHRGLLSQLILAVAASSVAMVVRVAQKNSSPAAFSIRCTSPSRRK